ncbi:DUF4112 domain-containing protein [Ketobacter alkanivorans]|uniref:DUF4112 domain-containing protein n=1 Tax=Ketobacter alkanivorans TaxID=1917421 RepID=A0A2K9LPH4_9GAMM|nr:DUF4112 domain-containing protein [Ketobacter alkanivorans]AUM14228.1 hypothetical protein Kalk_18155 [Ketobacter alkanivorans]MCP5018777.1 DUF4112 domain-containing protein [Ketobacter sp.]
MQSQPGGIYSLDSLKKLAYLLDDQFRVPFTRIRLGWDFILGLIPVAGDLLTACMSLFILVAARKYNISGSVMWKMLGNIIVDFLIGLIPVVGDFLDAGYKANAMNIKLLLAAIEQKNHDNLRK